MEAKVEQLLHQQELLSMLGVMAEIVRVIILQEVVAVDPQLLLPMEVAD
jgi:hypothetical protein